jgi:hypothetical protein
LLDKLASGGNAALSVHVGEVRGAAAVPGVEGSTLTGDAGGMQRLLNAATWDYAALRGRLGTQIV